MKTLPKLLAIGFLAFVLLVPMMNTADAGKRDRRERQSRKSSVNVVQSNNISIQSNVSQNANTGKNKVNKNTGGSVNVSTGSISQSVSISNTGGFNYLELNACCFGDVCDDGGNGDPDEECEYFTSWEGTDRDVAEESQGTTKGGDPVAPERSDVQDVMGAPDGDFYSFGVNGYIVVSLNEPMVNQPGDDLWMQEITNGRDTYPEELALVEVSNNGSDWTELGTASNKDTDGLSAFDLDSVGMDSVMYLRFTDTTDYSLHNNQADGYDLDAFMTTHQECHEVK